MSAVSRKRKIQTIFIDSAMEIEKEWYSRENDGFGQYDEIGDEEASQILIGKNRWPYYIKMSRSRIKVERVILEGLAKKGKIDSYKIIHLGGNRYVCPIKWGRFCLNPCGVMSDKRTSWRKKSIERRIKKDEHSCSDVEDERAYVSGYASKGNKHGDEGYVKVQPSEDFEEQKSSVGGLREWLLGAKNKEIEKIEKQLSYEGTVIEKEREEEKDEAGLEKRSEKGTDEREKREKVGKFNKWMVLKHNKCLSDAEKAKIVGDEETQDKWRTHEEQHVESVCQFLLAGALAGIGNEDTSYGAIYVMYTLCETWRDIVLKYMRAYFNAVNPKSV
jgi:hypothetical protein